MVAQLDVRPLSVNITDGQSWDWPFVLLKGAPSFLKVEKVLFPLSLALVYALELHF